MTRLVFILIFAWAAILTGYSSAQSTSQDVYAYQSGDLWKFNPSDGSARQLTHWGYTGGPILAPDGQKLAYLSTSPEFIAQFNTGITAQSAGAAPANVWIMDIASESHTLIADQSGASITGYLRSLPTWSPDSQQLAWLELDTSARDGIAADLMLHNLPANSPSLLAQNVDLGSQGSSIQMPILRWGPGGIAKLRHANPAGRTSRISFHRVFRSNHGRRDKSRSGIKRES